MRFDFLSVIRRYWKFHIDVIAVEAWVIMNTYLNFIFFILFLFNVLYWNLFHQIVLKLLVIFKRLVRNLVVRRLTCFIKIFGIIQHRWRITFPNVRSIFLLPIFPLHRFCFLNLISLMSCFCKLFCWHLYYFLLSWISSVYFISYLLCAWRICCFYQALWSRWAFNPSIVLSWEIIHILYLLNGKSIRILQL